MCRNLVGFFFFFQAEDGIRDKLVTGVQTCALPIWRRLTRPSTRRNLDVRGRCSSAILPSAGGARLPAGGGSRPLTAPDRVLRRFALKRPDLGEKCVGLATLALASQLFPPLPHGPRQLGGEPGDARGHRKGATQKRDGLTVAVLGQPEQTKIGHADGRRGIPLHVLA